MLNKYDASHFIIHGNKVSKLWKFSAGYDLLSNLCCPPGPEPLTSDCVLGSGQVITVRGKNGDKRNSNKSLIKYHLGGRFSASFYSHADSFDSQKTSS